VSDSVQGRPFAIGTATNVNVNVQAGNRGRPAKGPGIVSGQSGSVHRLVAGSLVIAIAYICAVTVIGLPFAFYLFNRIDRSDLRGRSRPTKPRRARTAGRLPQRGNIPQRPMCSAPSGSSASAVVRRDLDVGRLRVLSTRVLLLLVDPAPRPPAPRLMMFDRTRGHDG